MTFENAHRSIYLRLGTSWTEWDELIEFDFIVLPRIGEMIEILVGMETARPLRVIDIKHSIIDELQMTEILVWPTDMLT